MADPPNTMADPPTAPLKRKFTGKRKKIGITYRRKKSKTSFAADTAVLVRAALEPKMTWPLL